MKEKLKYLGKAFKSFLSDLKSLDKIIYNKWYKHMPIGFILGFGIYYLFRDGLVDTDLIMEYVIKLFVPIFGTLFLCIAWEFKQQWGRIIEEKERFESIKDIIAGFIPGVIGTIISILIFK